MKKNLIVSTIAFLVSLSCRMQATDFADVVVDYAPGANSSYTDQNAVLGQPGGIVGADSGYPNVFSPFSPHYESNAMTGIGYGGQLTLQLQNYVTIQPGAYEIGVWSNVGLDDADGNGTATNPTTTLSTPRSAVVSVSADGTNWVTLNGGSPIAFSLPGNYYTNAGPYDAAAPADPQYANFGQPFTGTLSSFDGEDYSQILSTLNGSAGGTWLDLDGTGLSEVGYIRFNGVPSGEVLDLNAVSINSTLAGGIVPEPGAASLLLVGVALTQGFKRRRQVLSPQTSRL